MAALHHQKGGARKSKRLLRTNTRNQPQLHTRLTRQTRSHRGLSRRHYSRTGNTLPHTQDDADRRYVDLKMLADYATPDFLKAIDNLVEFLKKDYQRIWLYTGENRVGKSTFALDTCLHVSSILKSNIWISFFYKTYEGEAENINDIRHTLGIEKYNIYPSSTEYGQIYGNTYDIHDLDEAVKSLHKGNSLSREAKMFLINYDIYGKRRYFYHMIMPEFEFIKGFRNKRSHMWIDIPNRGVACFHKPKRMKIDGIPQKQFPETPTWIEEFKPLDKEYKEIYEQIKDYMLRLGVRVEPQKERNLKRDICLRIKEKNPTITQEEMSYYLGVSQPTIGRMLAQ